MILTTSIKRSETTCTSSSPTKYIVSCHGEGTKAECDYVAGLLSVVVDEKKEKKEKIIDTSSEDSCKFCDFFNPYNVEHLDAFKYLNKNGFWPKDFIPRNCEMEPNWQITMFSKMAVVLADLGTDGHIYGMPAIEK